MTTADLLIAYETCARKGYWGLSWESQKMRSTQMTLEAIKKALVATESPDGAFGEIAGSEVMQLAQDRGMETETHRLFDSAINHAALADIVVSAIRKPSDPAWLVPPALPNWEPECFISPDGSTLRRVLLVSHWQDNRHYAECRSWKTLGAIAHYELPMSIVVCNIGQERDGLRTGPFSTGFRHPENHQLRFRKRQKGFRQPGNVFNDRWERIHREYHAEISRETWLEAMLRDDVLQDVCFRVDIPVPPRPHLHRVRDMASTKLERLYAMKEKPEASLSVCDFPIPCGFRHLCHCLPEKEPSEKTGFVQVNSLS